MSTRLKFQSTDDHKSVGGSPLANVTDGIATVLSNSANALENKEITNQIVSMESISDEEHDNIVSEFNDVGSQLKSAMEGLVEDPTDTQITAGTIVAMASGNPMGYHNAATAGAPTVSSDHVNVFGPITHGPAGSLNMGGDVASLESFEERDLRNNIAVSTVYNIAASRQDDFAETFYPTAVLTPDQTGLTMTVTATMVHREIRRAMGGSATKFEKVNLIHAPSDPTILESNATKLIPYANPDKSNASYFVDEALVAPRVVKNDDIAIRTAPLAVGVQFDLLGIAQAPGVFDGAVLDSTDALVPSVGLEKVYVKVSKGADTVVVPFNVLGLPRANFVPSHEGDGNDMELSFRNDAMILRPDSQTTVAGDLSATFKPLADYSLRLSMNVSGETNLERGTTAVYSNMIKVDKAYDVDGAELALSDAGVTAALAGITFEVIGVDINAHSTNSNRRTRGTILDSQLHREMYTVPLSAPITVPAPVTGDRELVDLKALIAASRTRTNNNAVTSLMNYLNRLEEHVEAIKSGTAAPAIEGIGRHLVVPQYRSVKINVKDAVKTRRSHEVAEDIRGMLVEVIRNELYRLDTDGNYSAALDFETGGSDSKPQPIIGTDPVLSRFIYETGNSEIQGKKFKPFKVASTPDKRMSNKIVIGFGRDGATDPLGSGTHVFIPELTSTVNVSRGGATTKETQVQPRSLHVNNLPLYAVIEIEGLEELLKDSTPLMDESGTIPAKGGVLRRSALCFFFLFFGDS